MALPFLMVTILSIIVVFHCFFIIYYSWLVDQFTKIFTDGISWIRHGGWFVIHYDSMIANHHNIKLYRLQMLINNHNLRILKVFYIFWLFLIDLIHGYYYFAFLIVIILHHMMVYHHYMTDIIIYIYIYYYVQE